LEEAVEEAVRAVDVARAADVEEVPEEAEVTRAVTRMSGSL